MGREMEGIARDHRARRRTASPFALVLVAVCVGIASPGAAFAQAEWWDLHDDAKKVVEDPKSSESQLNKARQNLETAIRLHGRERAGEGDEGYFHTYNRSVRIHFLPYFYRGWANLRLGRYAEASSDFQKSGAAGHISSGAPKDLKARFDNFSQLVPEVERAAAARDRASKDSRAAKCQKDPASAPGKSITESLAKLEQMLSAPDDAASLKKWTDALNDALGNCARVIDAAEIARLSGEYKAARDAVFVEGIAALLSAAVRSELEGAIRAGNDAETSGDKDGIKAATRQLKALPDKVTRDLDGSLSGLVREARKIASGNEAALNEQNQSGTRLLKLAGDVAKLKASGKSGTQLVSVVRQGSELKDRVAQARSQLEPLLRGKRNELATALSGFEQWESRAACGIDVVDASKDVDGAMREARAAKDSVSADEMQRATARLATVRAEADGKLNAALPQKKSQAQALSKTADDTIADLADASKKQDLENLKGALDRAVRGNVLCDIQLAMRQLSDRIGAYNADKKKARDAAIAQVQPDLDEATLLLGGFGAIFKPETVTKLQNSKTGLEGLMEGYDADGILKSGRELAAGVKAAKDEVQGQMRSEIQVIESLKKTDRWSTDVSAGRRRWLDENLAGVKRAVQTMSDAVLLAKFALESPRARLEMALVSAFTALYENDDAAGARKTLEDLGPGLRENSPSLKYALAYCYWWEGQNPENGESDSLLSQAKDYFAQASSRVDLSSLGISLFAPAFVQEMSRP